MIKILSFIFIFIVFKKALGISTPYNYSNTHELQWESYYSSLLGDLVSKSFRFNDKINLPSYIIKNNQIQPCELFNTLVFNPSIDTIHSNIYQIRNENSSQSNSNLIYSDTLNCYVLKNGDQDSCKINLPISRCTDNDSPNVSDFNGYNALLVKGYAFKESLQFYYSSKQSFHYYVGPFLKQFSDTLQFNRVDYYWYEMVGNLGNLVKSIIDLSQPSIPKNIGSVLASIDSSILSAQNKATIIDQTSFTINTILNSLNLLLDMVSSLSSVSPSSSSSYSIDSSSISSIQSDLVKLNSYQNSNLNIFFGSSQSFIQNIPSLFNSGQTLLEYYLEFTTTSNLIESIIKEILVLNQIIQSNNNSNNNNNNNNNIIYNIDLQQFNFNQLKLQESNLTIVLNFIKSSTNIDDSNSNTNTNTNIFYCNYLIIESIIKSYSQIINPTQQQQQQEFIFKLATFGDIGYCRELNERSSKLTMDLTISNQLSSIRELGNQINQDIVSFSFGFQNLKFITSSLFLSIIKDSGATQFQIDGLVLNVSYPLSTSKPTAQAPPGPLPVVTQNPNIQCQYPTCFLGDQNKCLEKPMSSLYFLSGECDLCQSIPENSNRTYLGGVFVDGKIGITPYCPYVCRLEKQYKLGDADDFNKKECVDAPIGYYSPSYSNTLSKCTIPSTFKLPNRLGFASNAASDTCLVSPLYQLIFTNSNYDQDRLVSPLSILDRGKTIEMWLAIHRLPNEDSIIGVTGVSNSWELSFIYKSSTKTITPAITNPSSQAIIFTDSSINISVLNLSTFFHFALVIESNNILSFYMNAKRIGKTIFSSSKLNQTLGFQYIGGQQFNRMSFLIDEYHNFNQALSPNQLGYKMRSEMILSSCNAQINQQLCNGKCVSCDSELGFSLNRTDCSCTCSDPINMELVNGKCLQKCPSPNSFRDSTLKCSCIDGEFKVLQVNSIKISSIHPYDSPDNYYSSNTDKKIGLKSIQLFNERGQLVVPASCSSTSNDGNNDCYGLFDNSASTYWSSSSFTGFASVLLNLKSNERISKISIEPLPNIFTMKSITIQISKDFGVTFETTVELYELPMQVNPVSIDFSLVLNDLKLFQCTLCPTIPSFKESEQSIPYLYPPTSNFPRDNVNTCSCFGRFSLDSYACMPPLPSPTFTLASGPYKTNTLVNLIYDIQVTTGYTLRYTIDSSDPLDTSPIFPIDQGIVFNNIETVVLKVRSFKSGRLTSYVASAIYYIQGLINCTLSPSPGNQIYDDSVNVKVNCETTPSYSSISSSWIFYTIDNSEPNQFSEKYNPKYGVTLQSNPTIGMNFITFKMVSQLEQYFSFTGEFLYKIQPTIPPPIFQPPDQLNFTNFVPLKILVPSIKDSESTSISTETYYQNYSIFYDVIPQGEIKPDQLTPKSGTLYNSNDYIIVECNFPSEGCLLHLRAIGCINEACSVLAQKYFKLSFNMTELVPTILSKYQSDSNSYLITIETNSNVLDLENYYNFKLLKSSTIGDDETQILSQCQKEFNINYGSSNLKYNLPFNISSSSKGYFCICSKNFKYYYGNLVNSNQVCKILVYTYQMDPPIFLQHGEYIESEFNLMVYEDISNYKHTGLFRVEVNNGVPTERSQLLQSSSIVLYLSTSLSYQMFSISAIDCAKGYICSNPSNTEITLRARCPNPYVSKSPGIYYNNVTVYGYCDGGCTPVFEYVNSSSPAIKPLSLNSPVFSSSLFLTSPNNEETITTILMMCADSLKANSETLDFQYNVQKFFRPDKPTITPGQSGVLGNNELIEMKCKSLDSRETCSILFTIRYADSKSNVPLEIDAIPQLNSDAMYDYQYLRPFRPNLVGHYYIVAITLIDRPYLQYDYTYSTENSIEILVFGVSPKVVMVPDVSLFYPSVNILLTSSQLVNQDTVLYYIANETDQYYNGSSSSSSYPPLSEFKSFNQSSTLTITSTINIYTFIEGKYYDLIDSSLIQTFSLVYDKEKEEFENNNNHNNHNNNLNYLTLLILLSAPIGYAIYKSYNFIIMYKYKLLLKNSKKTGLLLK